MKALEWNANQLRGLLVELQNQPDHSILDVSWDVSESELRQAWKTLALEFSPDIYQPESVSPEQRMLLREIYQTISDAYRRLKRQSQPVELLPPPEKIGSWNDPLR